jgi:hypothetical protein
MPNKYAAWVFMVKVKSDIAVEIDGGHDAVEREEMSWLENLILKSERLVVARDW